MSLYSFFYRIIALVKCHLGKHDKLLVNENFTVQHIVFYFSLSWIVIHVARYTTPCSVKGVRDTSFSIHLLHCVWHSHLSPTRACQANSSTQDKLIRDTPLIKSRRGFIPMISHNVDSTVLHQTSHHKSLYVLPESYTCTMDCSCTTPNQV